MTRRLKLGFTLVEMMAAVFTSSIVVLAAYALMDGTRDRIGMSRESGNVAVNVRNTEMLIKRDISRAGYHVPIVKTIGDVADPDEQFVYLCKKDGDNALLLDAVNFDLGNGVFQNNVGTYDTLAIMADITDYDGFEVTGVSGDVLTINRSIKLPLAASAFAGFPTAEHVNGKGPSGQTATDDEFDAIFDRSFQYAKAIYVETPTRMRFITPLKSWVKGANTTLTVSMCPGYTHYGLTGTAQNPFEGARVFPVVAIVYRVDECADGGSSGHCLYRCYADPFAASYDKLIPQRNWCQNLLANLARFDLAPLTTSKPSIGDGNFYGSAKASKLSELVGVGVQIDSGATTSGAGTSIYDHQNPGHVLSSNRFSTSFASAASDPQTAAYNIELKKITMPTK